MGYCILLTLSLRYWNIGAICYGLVMTLDKDAIPAKDMLVSTTVAVIVVTVFIQVNSGFWERLYYCMCFREPL